MRLIDDHELVFIERPLQLLLIGVRAPPHIGGGALGGTGLGVGVYRGARRAWRRTDKLRHTTPTRGLPSGEVLEHRFVNEGEQ